MGNNTLFHHTSFEYPVKTESEALEHIGSYAGHLPFMADSHVRPDGYGLLDHQLLQSMSMPMPMSTPKYSRFPGNFEIPPPSSYQPGPALSIASLESSCGSSSASPGSASSSFLFPPSTTYSTNGSTFISQFSPATSTGYSPSVNYQQPYCPFVYNNNRARTTSMPSSSGMPPPTPSPGSHTSVSSSARKDYADPVSHISRYRYDPHAHPGFGTNTSLSSGLTTPRSINSYSNMSSTSQSAYGPSSTPQGVEASGHFRTLTSQNNVPPFQPTRMWVHKVMASNGDALQVDVQAKIDKGFFKADQDWTCYRRNYFSVACSYTLSPYNPQMEPLSLRKTSRESSLLPIRSFAICISARIDSEEGKLIELVQHTPKRDKGPTGRPEKIKLHPNTSLGAISMHSGHGGGLGVGSGLSSDYESSAYPPTSPTAQQSQTVASFDRIQFKNATANNGKRRAAQQYFHIVVELFAEVSSNQASEVSWTKVASRISAPMVVRGRSPGHYSDDRRGSSTSMGPGGGSTGESSGSQQDPHSGSSGIGRSGVAGMFNNPPRLSSGGSGNQTGHHASSDYAPADNLSDASSTSSEYEEVEMQDYERPNEPVLTPEEEDNIENHDGYQYYPSTLLTAPAISNVPRPVLLHSLNDRLRSGPIELPSPRETWYRGSAAASDNAGRRVQPRVGSQDFHNSHIDHASSSGSASNGVTAQSCGRFHGVDTSRGHYPTTPAW